MVTTDPFEILDAGKTLNHENFYKSKRNSWKQNEQYFKFEDLKMPILSHELRQSSEGAISLEGCTEVFKSFPPSKVPSNDGLEVDFYKMVLASIGKRLA